MVDAHGRAGADAEARGDTATRRGAEAQERREGATPAGSRWRRMGKAVAFGLGVAVPVTALAFIVREKFLPVIELDERIIVWATDVTRSHPAFKEFLLVWQEVTQPKWLYIAATGLCIWVWRRHGLKSRAIWAFVTMMVAWNLQLMLKLVVQRARPVVSDPVSHAPGYSFPSGHVANAAAIAAAVLLLIWPIASRRTRTVVITLASLVVAMTMADRVFLGVHFPSDVVGGLLFGAGLVGASYLGYLGWNPHKPDDASPPEGETGPESKGNR